MGFEEKLEVVGRKISFQMISDGLLTDEYYRVIHIQSYCSQDPYI